MTETTNHTIDLRSRISDDYAIPAPHSPNTGKVVLMNFLAFRTARIILALLFGALPTLASAQPLTIPQDVGVENAILSGGKGRSAPTSALSAAEQPASAPPPSAAPPKSPSPAASR